MTAAPNSPLVERVALAIASTDYDQVALAKSGHVPAVYSQDRAKAQAALAACEFEAIREMLEDALLTSAKYWKPKALALLARLEAPCQR
jgi:hypothetical protein